MSDCLGSDLYLGKVYSVVYLGQVICLNVTVSQSDGVKYRVQCSDEPGYCYGVLCIAQFITNLGTKRGNNCDM